MIKTCMSIALIFSSIAAFADKKINYPFKPSDFKVTPLNSPVRQGQARFKLEFPPNFTADHVRTKVVNTNNLSTDQSQFQSVIVKNFELGISVEKLPPGFYRLYVKLKNKNKDDVTYSSATHDFVRFVIDDSLEVPNPNPRVNNSSLEGIDSDKDGIRDDVQRFINQTYPSQNVKLALKQLARASQQALIKVKDKATAIQFVALETKSQICLASQSQDSSEISNQVHKLLFNTEARVKKHFQINSYMHGETWPKELIDYQTSGIDQDNIFCDFESER